MKKSKNPPVTGDNVLLRGRGPEGILTSVTDEGWAFVDWYKGVGPKIVSITELEKIK
jgi:uncharacterized protein YodC (DUF2158 family)